MSLGDGIREYLKGQRA